MNPINTVLCSFGMSGLLFHAPFISVNPNFNFYGVLERTKSLAENKYPSVKTFRTLTDLLADDSVELVVVNTPNFTHFDFSKEVIKAGKHLIVEKPFTATVEEANELIALADKHHVLLSIFQNRRFDSDFKTVQKVLNEKLLGDLVEAEFHYDRFDPELSYKTHKERPTIAVGSLYDLGSHIIDQALVLFGMPNAVYADLDAFRWKSKVTDYFNVTLFYRTHRVILKSSYFVREALPGYVLHGKKGSFIKTKADVQEADLQAGKKPNSADWGHEPKNEQGLLHTEIDGKIIKKCIPTLTGNYMTYYDNLFAAIRNNEPLIVTPQEATNVIKIIQAALKSNTKRRVINL